MAYAHYVYLLNIVIVFMKFITVTIVHFTNAHALGMEMGRDGGWEYAGMWELLLLYEHNCHFCPIRVCEVIYVYVRTIYLQYIMFFLQMLIEWFSLR